MSEDNPYQAYPVLLSIEAAAALLSDAADVHPTSISTISASTEQGGAGILMELDAGTTPITLVYVAEGVRLSELHYRILSNLGRERRQHHQAHRKMVGADLETLQEFKLPLYWNHEWRAEKYAETGSFNALAAKYKREVQGVRGTSIYALDRKYVDGIRVVEAVPQKRRSKRDQFAEYYEEKHAITTQTAMAKHFRVTKSTISRWIRELTALYQALEDNPSLARNRGAFALEHNIDPAIIRQWLVNGSTAFQKEPVKQPKAQYFDRDRYENLFKVFEERYQQADGAINQSRLARELNVDRSTIRQWMRRIEKVHVYKVTSE